MKIKALTANDDALAAVATDLADRLFPELPAAWRIGTFQHQVVLESRRLFLGSADFFEIGRVNVLGIPGVKGPLIVGTAWQDYGPTVNAHGVNCNCLGLCDREQSFILIDLPRDESVTDNRRAVILHEFGHTIGPALPPHGSAWRATMRRTAEAARDADQDDLAVLIDKGWKQYRPAPDAGPDSEKPGVFFDAYFRELESDRQRFKIVLSDGVSLSAWLAKRRAENWGPEDE